MIRITSKRDGFRRCGIEHPARPTCYPDGFFTAEQLARLKAEPMLVVEEVAEAPEEQGRPKARGKAGKDEDG